MSAVRHCRPLAVAYTHDQTSSIQGYIYICQCFSVLTHGFQDIVYIYMDDGIEIPRTVLILFVKKHVVSEGNPIYHHGWSWY